jgi:hypothetical protein
MTNAGMHEIFMSGKIITGGNNRFVKTLTLNDRLIKIIPCRGGRKKNDNSFPALLFHTLARSLETVLRDCRCLHRCQTSKMRR